MSDQKKVIVTSPVGETEWFNLVKPDKFGKYSVNLIVEDTPELQKIMSQMDELITDRHKAELDDPKVKPEAKRKLKLADSKPIEPEFDSEGKETGRYKIKLRLKAEGKKKDDTIYKVQRPVLFDNLNKKISDAEAMELRIFNGSLIKVNFEMSPYCVKNEVGVTFKPKAVQVKKIQQGSANASSYGFSADETTPEDASDSDEFSSESTSQGGSDGEDF